VHENWSHNLVLGQTMPTARSGGIVSGINNILDGDLAVPLGGI
jgi:hypothetical protein